MKIDYIQKIELCIAYIEANLNHKVSIEDVLENTYYSYPHFHRLTQNQQYTYGEHQWLEEHITEAGKGGFHSFKLFMPLQTM